MKIEAKMKFGKSGLLSGMGGALAVLSLLLFATAPVSAGSNVVMKDGKKYHKIDGQLFPALSPLGPPPIPLDNPQTVDKDGWPLMDDPKVQLGKLLYFDPRISGDGSVSCSTCHVQGGGWGLNSAVSRAYPGFSHWRNSLTVINSGYMKKLFWDGHSKSLETVGKGAAQGIAGNAKADMVSARLQMVPAYKKMYKEVFGSMNNPLSDAYRAMASFQRALNHTDTPVDNYLKGDKSALDASQVRGMKLFTGKARCIMCHNSSLLSDENYYNTGVPRQMLLQEVPLNQAAARQRSYGAGITEEHYRNLKADTGLALISNNKADMGKFRTQQLRYLVYTPPYMHNGSIDSLDEVVDFYNAGGGEDIMAIDQGIATKTKVLKPLNLTDQEKEDLVAFLEGWSGPELEMMVPEIPKSPAMITVK